MGFLDTLLGRTKPAQPNLDELFELPTAAITLEAGMNLVPTGTGSVCFRAAEGKAFSDIETDVRELLGMGSRHRLGRGDHGQLRVHVADLPAQPRMTSRRWSPTCTR